MTISCLAILQARLSSTRLPGKVLMPILGEPMLLRQIERVRRSRKIERLIVATSTDASDDELAAVCERAGVECSRGSLADVLDRFYQIVHREGAETVVRLTGDCPLADPAVIDAVIDAYSASPCDYASNILVPTYPDGLDVEVFSADSIGRAWREASSIYDREHVTPYIYMHDGGFALQNVTHSPNLSGHRWTVDTLADFELVRAIYTALYPQNPAFAMQDILAFLEQKPDLAAATLGPIRPGPLAEKSITQLL